VRSAWHANRVLSVVALIAATAAVAAGCGSSSSNSSSSSAAAPTSSSSGTSSAAGATGTTPASSTSAPLAGKKIIFSECCQDPMFDDAWYPGIQAAMAWSKQGGSVSNINANGDNTTQLSQIQNIIGQKSAAAVLTVTEAGSGYATLVKSAHQAKLIWGNYAGNPAPGADLNILYPHYQAGYISGVAAGKWLKRTNGGQGDAGTTINPTDPGLSERTAGFNAGVKSVVPNIHLYQASAAAGSVEDGSKVASELLSTHPSIKILFCYNETLSLGCLQGASAAGHTDPKSLYIVDADASTVGLKDILKGTPIQEAVTPDYEGDMAVLTLITERALEGKSIPHTGVANVKLVTKADAAAELDAQEHPFASQNVQRTLGAVRLYPGSTPPYSNSNIPKGPGLVNYFQKNPF
jgi:ribose transport system substrate-binding protein